MFCLVLLPRLCGVLVFVCFVWICACVVCVVLVVCISCLGFGLPFLFCVFVKLSLFFVGVRFAFRVIPFCCCVFVGCSSICFVYLFAVIVCVCVVCVSCFVFAFFV